MRTVSLFLENQGLSVSIEKILMGKTYCQKEELKNIQLIISGF